MLCGNVNVYWYMGLGGIGLWGCRDIGINMGVGELDIWM